MFVHPTSEVSQESVIGQGTKIWHQAQIMEDTVLGTDCTVGKGVFIGIGSTIGNLVKIGNYANIFGAAIEDEVFIGPMVCTLQDSSPRATNLNGARKSHTDYVSEPVTIRRGASVGAGAIVLPGVTIGQYAMVAAGSVVNKNVSDYVMVAGNPARAIGYVCRCGHRLNEDFICDCNLVYQLTTLGLELKAQIENSLSVES